MTKTPRMPVPNRPKKIDSRVPCPVCEGRGKVVLPSTQPPREVVCGQCKGQGKVDPHG